jgi:hypothetical protein
MSPDEYLAWEREQPVRHEYGPRIFHVESIIQDPNVQELISEWEDKGRAAEARLLLHKVLAARSFRLTPDVRARIDGEPDVTRLEAWLEAAVTARAIGDVFQTADELPARSAVSRRRRPDTRRRRRIH